MLVSLGTEDTVTVKIGDEVHSYGPGAATVRRDETSTRGGDKSRFLSIVVPLRAGEFPESTGHVAG